MNSTTATSQSWSDRMQRLGLIIDLSMVALVIINLIWLVFDSLFEFEGVQSLLSLSIGPAFVSWYDETIHQWFIFYDLGFVAIFLTELLASWAYAIRHKTYSHWMAYPFIHWYDVLGCIPVGSLRALRILRLFAVLVRLQKMGVIDYTQWSLYQLFQGWYNIALEELSDRIAVKILEGVQKELYEGDDLERKVIAQVVMPRKDMLIDSLSEKLAVTTKDIYADTKSDLETYIKQIVGQAMHENTEIGLIEKLPMFGTGIGKLLDHTVTDIVCKSIENAVDSLDHPQFKRIVSEVADALLESAGKDDDQPTGVVTDAIADLLEVVKSEIRIQRWKEAKV